MKIRTGAQIVVLLAVLLSGCFNDKEYQFKWEGEDWKAEFEYIDTELGDILWDIDIYDPSGKKHAPEDPAVPFKIIQIKDGDYQLVPRPRNVAGAPVNASLPRRASGPYFVYLLDVYATDQILIFQQDTNRYQGRIVVPIRPQGIALSPDGKWLYVTHLETEAGNPFFPPAPPRVSVIDTAARSIVQTINLNAGVIPRKPLVSPDGRWLYVPNDASTNPGIVIVDASSRAVVGNIPLTTGPDRLVITPDGALIYAIPTQAFPARLFAIDTATREAFATIPLSLSLRDMLVNLSGSRLYLTTVDTVVVYDTATLTELTRIPIPGNPRINVLSLSFDGGSLFANHEFSQAITRINTATNQIAETLGDPAKATQGSFSLMVPLGPPALQ